MKMMFECTALRGVNKEGKLTPDASGYYTTVLGAYGMKNSNGLFYDRRSAEILFASDRAIFQRLIAKGSLYGEMEHPGPRPYINANGQLDKDAYFARLRRIDPKNWAVHIRRVYLKEMVNDEGQPILAVIGEVKPQGEYVSSTIQALENPDSNVWFSVRSFTNDDLIRGIRETVELVTWDLVPEGGIAMANKMRSPALECFDSIPVTADMIIRANLMDKKVQSMSGMEAADMSLDNISDVMGLSKHSQRKVPELYKW